MENNRKTEHLTDDLPRALICEENPKIQPILENALINLNYNPDIASTADETYEKMRYNDYKIVVINENFAGGNSENNEVVEYLQYLPLQIRRAIFLVLIGRNVKTRDSNNAFSKSVNLVVNEKDINELNKILKSAISGNALFYKVYNDILKELGKQ
ncbi:hypothetical protein MCHI_002548 [Candidatus Magnetoovum chiemensis]|nr:hypothetical protein MCHI_002548 [Candidatus Magnetoovum chiemensis]